MTEFNKNALETLRGPLEDREITISRVDTAVTYPCNFIFIASMNPCPCGYYGSSEKECKCQTNQIKKYLNKISGPLLDRIDLQVEISKIEYKNLNSNTEEETSKAIQKRVNKARNIQKKRYLNDNIFCNAQMNSKLIKKYCELDKKSKEILEKAFNNLGLSARAYTRILKVARTIADLEGEKAIKVNHVLEAIQYRSLDRKYW